MVRRELELSAHHEAAGQARQEVADALSGTSLRDLTNDAKLVVSELVTNATLHGAPPWRLAVEVSDDRVRLSVFDSSPSPPGRNHTGEGAMTGRGLMVIEALTVRRGVERKGIGKEVWAELSGGASADADDLLGAFLSTDELTDVWADLDEPEDVMEVELGDVSTKLLIDAKTHTDNVIREFTLTTVGQETGATGKIPEELARLIRTVTTEYAQVRRSIKEQALAAEARDEERTNLRVRLTAETAEAGPSYLHALDEADAYCRAGRLLTLETPAQHKILRRW